MRLGQFARSVAAGHGHPGTGWVGVEGVEVAVVAHRHLELERERRHAAGLQAEVGHLGAVLDPEGAQALQQPADGDGRMPSRRGLS